MSAENLETLARIYEGWERGDFSVGVADFAREATLVIEPEIPDAGEYDGLEGIRNYMTHFLSAWESLTIKARSFREADDDTVLVQVDQNGIGQGSGAPATLNYFHIWTFREDGKVIRLESILREAKALKAAGLSADQGPKRPFRVLSILDEETVAVQGGALQWLPLRRRLGIGAFGTNVYRAARTGDPVVEEHVESPGQEELYVVLQGRVKFVVGEEELEAPVGTALFVEDPDVLRRGDALDDDTVVMAVGGWPGQAYHSLPWEPIYLAQEAMRRGDWAGAADTLEREGGEHLDTAVLQYRLACCHARAGEHDRPWRS